MKIEGLEALIALIPELQRDALGEWADTGKHAGTCDDPLVMPYVVYNGELDLQFEQVIYAIVNANPELDLKDYAAILERNGLEWSDESLRNADVSKLDSVCVLAMILSIIRADRFNEGILLRYFENGRILAWIKRLQELEG